MTKSSWLAFLILFSTIMPAFPAESHCPASVDGVSLRHISRYQMLVPVSVNHSGPFDFLLDTGTQVTILDTSLAKSLNLKAQGLATLRGVGFQDSASVARVSELAVGANAASDLRVLVSNVARMKSSGLHINGILGEDFLRRFDMLIDNAHGLLCLDDVNLMRTGMTGQRITLFSTPKAADGDASTNSLIMSVSLPNEMRQLRLLLDSGSDAPFLFAPSEVLVAGAIEGHLRGGGMNGEQQTLLALPPQEIEIGGNNWSETSFLTMRNDPKRSRAAAYDGLLPTGLFRSIFVSQSGEFAVLDPNYPACFLRVSSRNHRRCLFFLALRLSRLKAS